MKDCSKRGAPFPEGVFGRGQVLVLTLGACIVGAILGYMHGLGDGINEVLPVLRRCMEVARGDH